MSKTHLPLPGELISAKVYAYYCISGDYKCLSTFSINADSDYVLLGTTEAAFQVPADYKPEPAVLAALGAQREKIVEKFSEALAAHDQKVAQFLALEG